MSALVRQAICMGLHRDPVLLHQKTVPDREVHRRLWNTVLELTLQSSLTSRDPPLIYLHDYNNDDKPLTDDTVPSSADTFTQTFIARVLRKTFPQRLAVDKRLNNRTVPETYKPTLRLDEDLRSAYKEIGRALKACSSSSTES